MSERHFLGRCYVTEFTLQRKMSQKNQEVQPNIRENLYCV